MAATAWVRFAPSRTMPTFSHISFPSSSRRPNGFSSPDRASHRSAAACAAAICAGAGSSWVADLALLGLFYLPQRDLLSARFTVRQQLAFVQTQFDGADVEHIARDVGIHARLDQRPNTLSGGERRRAELAALLIRRPTCVLADEPYRGLAPLDAETVTRVLRSLTATGAAVVVTGHEVPTLLAAADHVTWCTSGTTYELGTPHAAAQHEAFRREYLGALDWSAPTA